MLFDEAQAELAVVAADAEFASGTPALD